MYLKQSFFVHVAHSELLNRTKFGTWLMYYSAFNFLTEYVLVVNERYACIQKNMRLPGRPGAVASVPSFLQKVMDYIRCVPEKTWQWGLRNSKQSENPLPKMLFRVARMGTGWQRHFAATSSCLAFPLLHLNHPAHRAPLNANASAIEECDMGSWGLSSTQKERSLFVEGPLHAWVNG